MADDDDVRDDFDSWQADPAGIHLKLDQALLRFNNGGNKELYLFKQFKECYKCPLLFWANLNASQTTYLKTDTNYELEYAITDINDTRATHYCQNTHYFWDQSKSNISISEHNNSGTVTYSCDLFTEVEGRSNIWPLVGAALIYIVFAAAFYTLRKVYYKWRERRAMSISLPSDPVSGSPKPDEKKRKRLKSLDCFRGITILMMIFVNMGAGDYEYLDHAAWDGFNFADIIFPWFVFIMGTTMAISYKSIVIRQKQPAWKIFYKITLRSIKLFIIGIMLNSLGRADFRTLRIPGVLQRFGISYFVVASSHVVSLLLHKGELFGALRIHQLVDIIPYWPEWIVATFMAILYFSLTFGWTFDPNCPKGYIEPGGLYNNVSNPYCTGGAAAKIDKWLLGEKHIYPWFTGKKLYDPLDQFKLKHDPEGVLGTTTSIILTFLGLQLGKILIAYPNPKQRLVRWISWGVVLGCLCGLLAGTGWVPINKNLWSFSFICLTASGACFALSVLYYLIDVARIWPDGQPFHYPGMNSIFLYIGHELCGKMIPFSFNVDESSHVGPLARNLTAATFWFIVSVVLAENDFFFTV